MPPKKPSTSTGSKVAIDKTFGMKNKKGGKGQAAVALAQQQAAQQGRNKEVIAKEKAKADREKEKEAERKRAAELNDLFKPVQVAQKVPFGTDPKTVLCQYFKTGTCDKGNKCKFAHDLNVERKSAKKDLYTDARDEAKEKDTMDQWDDEKLNTVIISKHGNPKTTTDIICKNFLEAVESGKYGWFWECPNGGVDCKYRHALPPGFVLKSQRKKAAEDAANKKFDLSLEEFLEKARHQLSKQLTPVTKESFAIWKQERIDKAALEEELKRKAKEQQAAAGRMNGMSGRDLFTYDTTGVYGDDAFSDDENGDQDEWDLERYRLETETERQKMEDERIQSLGGNTASSLQASSDG